MIAVLAEGHPVVGEDQEQGVLEEVELFHPVQEAAEPAVYHSDLGGVAGVHPLQLPLREIVARAVDHGVGLPAVVGVVVEVDVLVGGVPGLVRVVAVGHEEERLVASFGRLQQLHGSREDPRGEPVLFALPFSQKTPLHVRPVLLHLGPHRGDVALEQGVLHSVVREGPVRHVVVGGLAPDEVEDVEALLEVV